MKAGELNQKMRLDIVGLKDMRSALVDNPAECANNVTVEGAALADYLAVDACLASRGDEPVGVLGPADVGGQAGFQARQAGQRVLAGQRAELEQVLGRPCYGSSFNYGEQAKR